MYMYFCHPTNWKRVLLRILRSKDMSTFFSNVLYKELKNEGFQNWYAYEQHQFPWQ